MLLLCLGKKFPDTLTKNSAGAAAARKRNSCGNVKINRCSPKYDGYVFEGDITTI